MRKTILPHLIFVLVLFFPLGGLLGESISKGVFLTLEFVYIYFQRNDLKISKQYIAKIAGLFGIFVLSTAISYIVGNFFSYIESSIVSNILLWFLLFVFWSLGIFACIKLMEKGINIYKEHIYIQEIFLIILASTVIIGALDYLIYLLPSSKIFNIPDTALGLLGMMSGGAYISSPLYWICDTLLPLSAFYALCLYMIRVPYTPEEEAVLAESTATEIDEDIDNT